MNLKNSVNNESKYKLFDAFLEFLKLNDNYLDIIPIQKEMPKIINYLNLNFNETFKILINKEKNVGLKIQ